jgi:glutathione-regulated potassium-efflux system protein KefB
MDHSLLIQIAVFLTAAAIAAPLAKQLKIGAVLGYLFAGLFIGPYGLAIFKEPEAILHTAEFGVVLLLFVIGLELRPARLWSMRSAVFGVGTFQVALSAALLLALLMISGKSLREGLFIGLALALSSTAFVIQVLKEKGELGQPHGRLGFSVLLFQDLAAIPLIAFVGLFSIGGGTGEPMTLAGFAKAVAAIGLVIVAGHYLLGYLYKLAALTGLKEAMTASALLSVILVALIMEFAGLSAALGAFIAGALLADSEYRHEIEADIAPFEGLLLGLFFVAIGMSLNLNLLTGKPVYVITATILLIATKAAVLWGLARWHGLPNHSARRFALALSQGGEFAFVLAAAGHNVGAVFRPAADMISVVVTLSMMATPLLLLVDDALQRRGLTQQQDFDEMPEKKGHVIIAGFGRFGQIIARILSARGIHFTALDNSVTQIDFVRRFGNKIYYGDPTRLDILKAAQADQAIAFVLAIDDPDASIKTAALVRRHFPDLPIFARARDRDHAHRLMQAGVDDIEREMFLSSLELSRRVLRATGMGEADARRTIQLFAESDRRRLAEDIDNVDEHEKLRDNAKRHAKELEELFERDADERSD